MATRPVLASRPPLHAARRRRTGTALNFNDVVALAGAALWIAGLSAARLARMNDLGLISVLDAPCIAGLAAVIVAFVVQLARAPEDRWRPALYIVGLVLMLDGFPAFIESAGDVPTAYLHAGFIDYILHHGAVLPNYDARFSWPGMFVWGALATVAGGRGQALAYIRWAPLALDLLYLLPLRIIFRTLCPNARAAWAAAGIFVVGNWVEQDYFAPQGVAMLGYLTVIAVILATSRPAPPLGATTMRERLHGVAGRLWHPWQPMQMTSVAAQTGTLICLTLIVAAVVSSHQLTPYTLLLELVVLAVFGNLATPTLIFITAALSLGYLSLGAQGFWQYHLSEVLGGVGHVSSSVNQGLVARVHVSAGHKFVVEARLLYAVLLVAAAGLGALLRRRRERWGLVASLAAAPWLLVLGQAYGGEVFLRSLFLSLPFLAVLIAEVFAWLMRRQVVVGSVVVALLLIAGSGALVLTRYGNEPFYLTTPNEIAAVTAVDRGAPRGSVVAVLAQNLPWRFENIEDFTFVSYQAKCANNLTMACFQQVDADYIIITQGQRQTAELLVGMTNADINRLEAQTLPAAGYRLVYRNPDAQVYAHNGTPGLARPPAQGQQP